MRGNTSPIPGELKLLATPRADRGESRPRQLSGYMVNLERSDMKRTPRRSGGHADCVRGLCSYPARGYTPGLRMRCDWYRSLLA
jgi:hypothetical protein